MYEDLALKTEVQDDAGKNAKFSDEFTLENIEIEIKFGCCKKLHMLSHNKALVSKKRCNVAFCVQYKWGV